MKTKAKLAPGFATEAEERIFWETHDSSEYFNWSKAERARLPNLKQDEMDIRAQSDIRSNVIP